MNTPPEINVNPIRYYQVTSYPRQGKVYPLHTSKGFTCTAIEVGNVNLVHICQGKSLPKSGAAQLHPNRVNVYI